MDLRDKGLKDFQLPFTLPLVHKLMTYLRNGCFGLYTDLLLEAVILTAFYGFLRGGEFTSQSFDPSDDLFRADVTLYPHYYSILLKHSKTDRDKKERHFPFLQLIQLSVLCLP